MVSTPNCPVRTMESHSFIDSYDCHESHSTSMGGSGYPPLSLEATDLELHLKDPMSCPGSNAVGLLS